MPREKLNIRLPTDEGPNPYDSSTHPRDYPAKDWQIAGRGFEWWFGVVGIGLVMGIAAYLKTKA